MCVHLSVSLPNKYHWSKNESTTEMASLVGVLQGLIHLFEDVLSVTPNFVYSLNS